MPKLLAKKVIRVNGSNVRLIQGELEALLTLHGVPNIVEWDPDVAFDRVKEEIHLHMSFYPDGDLAKFIRSRYVDNLYVSRQMKMLTLTEGESPSLLFFRCSMILLAP
jgi:hypothetical protein